ncbi:C2H2 type zinc finger domain protein [Aspergillus homomorphus CBS 101889]|uniref:C2H2 type zinc finger domain protein n=1 Tax=Aspergillus homomorphus (strain CBS 101889) TaxID=1450537 RepID=A0A395HMG0_ASPHC|nr:C2H2 type zinc finger domain protein [Aspergillus homomorphus CBS 101889]RAL08048.1 C2H2 type zinc finger domain protein [Aspergillus homomorphus CBS 101889]
MDTTHFSCSHPGCGRTYRRKEHLTRHMAGHRQITAAACPFCDKTFSRNDTLRQHVRLNHKDKKLNSSRTIEACKYCRSRRSRCDGKAPCGPCQQRGLQCSLESHQARHQVPESEAVPHSVTTSPSFTAVSPDLPSPEESPTNIQPYVDAYFDKFHPIWPFVHRATFDLVREPPFLLQCVTMLGLWVTGDPKSQQAAFELHERLSLSIYQQRDKWEATAIAHSDGTWPMATYQGILLNVLFALISATPGSVDLQLTRTLPALPSQLLLALVRTCRQQDLFSYPTIRAQFTRNTAPDVFIWLGIEEVKRFALSLYRVSAMVRVQESHVPVDDASKGECLVSLEELRFAMPERDDLWNANSDLAATLARDNLIDYDARNMEVDWISNAGRLLRRDGVRLGWA